MTLGCIISQGIIPRGHGGVATRFEVPQLAELAEDPPADFLDHGSDVRVRRWLAWHKTWLEALVRTIEIDALKEDHMKMEIEETLSTTPCRPP